MESTSLQTPDDALSYIAPIGEFVPYTCNVTASHPTIRTRVRSLQRRWLLSCLSEIGQTLLLFSCCLACRLTYFTSPLITQTAKYQSWYRVRPARSIASDSGSWVETSHAGPAVQSHRRLDTQICLCRLLPMILASCAAAQGMPIQVDAAFE